MSPRLRKNRKKFREIEHHCKNDTQADIENAAREQSQTAYVEQYDSWAEWYELGVLKVRLSGTLRNATVERLTVYADERLVFRFKNGAEVGMDMQQQKNVQAEKSLAWNLRMDSAA